MSRKDYELIAKAINEERIAVSLNADYVRALMLMSHRLASALLSDNPRFNRATFINACGF